MTTSCSHSVQLALPHMTVIKQEWSVITINYVPLLLRFNSPVLFNRGSRMGSSTRNTSTQL